MTAIARVRGSEHVAGPGEPEAADTGSKPSKLG
jgi:NCS2 family nucleobase:cation symporter-2